MRQFALGLVVLTAYAGAQMTPGPSKMIDQKRLTALEKAYKVSKAAYLKHPRDAAKRHAYVVATVKYGDGSMRASELPPKVKYRQALHLFREALKLDPSNPVAKPEADLIISIYKSMGRPVPPS